MSQTNMRSLCAGLIGLAASCFAALVGAQPLAQQGRFNVVTYNVAGLPEGLSNVRPQQNLPVIGAGLNKYDLVLVQEDYAYPELLRSRLRLPHQSPAYVRGQALHFGDGLSDFSRFPLSELRREAWRQCHGVLDAYFDCLTPKGLAMARVELSPGVVIDAYNVHLDAGSSAGDVTARSAQLRQLFQTIADWSRDRAVLVAGDFNLTSAELAALRSLASAAGLSEACDTLRCGQPWRLDRVLYRAGPALKLRAHSWALDRSFRDARGQQLSDHLAVVVGFQWRTPPAQKPQTALQRR